MGKSTPQSNEGSKQDSLISHLVELRSRLLRVIVGVIVVFACLYPFANETYTYLAGPLLAHMPAGSSMVAIDVASSFLTPLKMVLLLAVVLSIPWILYQVWAFIAPGLYRHEKRLALPLLVSSSVLFYTGMAFAYYVMFPLAFGFFTRAAPEGVTVMTDIGRYLDFVIKIFLAFGISFEIPVATFVLIRMGVVSVESLVKKRPYVILATFILGAMLTPPDVLSQFLLAIPMWLLFEVGVLIAKLAAKPKEKEFLNEERLEPSFRNLNDDEAELELNETELIDDVDNQKRT